MHDDTTDGRGTENGRTSSRRGFMSKSAALGTGALALGSSGLAGTVLADDRDDGGSDGTDGQGDENGKKGRADVDILNYALTLEHLEATFYRQGMEEFSASEFVNADVACSLCEQRREMIPEHVEVVGEHEAAHVDAIAGTIEDLGGDPVPEAEYDFGYETPSEFLELAMVFENTGVAAYAGAGPDIKDDELVAAALSIHSVEARHAAVFNSLNGESPFPNAFDEPKSMEEVTEAVSQFIVSE